MEGKEWNQRVYGKNVGLLRSRLIVVVNRMQIHRILSSLCLVLESDKKSKDEGRFWKRTEKKKKEGEKKERMDERKRWKEKKG